MADWLKVRHALVRSAKVRGLMRALHCKKHVALGVALNWLVWLDEQTEDGLTHLMPKELDDEIGFSGCTDAMISIGWATLGSDGCVEAIEFGKHCGESAKKRAENAARQASFKARQRSNARSNAKSNASALPNALPEENRIEENDKGVCKAVVNNGANAPCNATVPQSPAEPERVTDADDPPGVSECGAEQSPSRPSWGAWMSAVAQAHPSCSRSRTLAPDVESAARAAYERFPDAIRYAELLAAYYASRLQEDSRRVKFYRPQAQRWYFEQLEDIVTHAERWKREMRWKPESERKPKPSKAPSVEPEEELSNDALRAFFEEMRAEDSSGQGNTDEQTEVPEAAGGQPTDTEWERALRAAMK